MKKLLFSFAILLAILNPIISLGDGPQNITKVILTGQIFFDKTCGGGETCEKATFLFGIDGDKKFVMQLSGYSSKEEYAADAQVPLEHINKILPAIKKSWPATTLKSDGTITTIIPGLKTKGDLLECAQTIMNNIIKNNTKWDNTISGWSTE